MKAPTVCCPTCGTEVAWTESSTWRPFCSDRCRAIDLGEWASGSYAIAVDALNESTGDVADLPNGLTRQVRPR
jgi:endogenous inhibitor of DNA gyrase (YacG/DUF329 family)